VAFSGVGHASPKAPPTGGPAVAARTAPARQGVDSKTGALLADLVAMLARGVLPFQSGGATGASAAAASASGGLPFQASAHGTTGHTGDETPAGPSKLSLEQYASLCAELAVFPQHVEAIFERYQLLDLRERQTEDLGWQDRLRRNVAEQQEWQARYSAYFTYWSERAGHGPRR
jgi:hypothetical protein